MTKIDDDPENRKLVEFFCYQTIGGLLLNEMAINALFDTVTSTAEREQALLAAARRLQDDQNQRRPADPVAMDQQVGMAPAEQS